MAAAAAAFAHSANAQGCRHDLVEHLRETAHLAAAFAAKFEAEQLGHWIGLWHDLGKFHPAWQRYLIEAETATSHQSHPVEHKGAGARLASQHLGLVALLIQGHHGGLRTPTDLQTWLTERATESNVGEALQRARQTLPDLEPTDQVSLPGHVLRDPSVAELFLRILFSALVDADFLDTERHFSQATAVLRDIDITLPALWERFERNQQRLSGQHTDTVGQARHAIYQACLAAAEQPPGLFRLTVPTGGGKTRSAMAFALRHALHCGHERVIVGVPFISITEQTADVYRDIFGTGSDGRPIVLEHHSAAERVATEDDEFQPARIWARLAAENWDAPIVVTTTVQLFESLFACQTSRTRKLHRLARSVIILDEAQALPPHLLAPILDALQQLCAHYGTTVVISTATQPAFEAIPVFATVPAIEIVPHASRFFQALRRVEYDWRTDQALTWSEAADLLCGQPQALAVVNTKKDALALLDALGDPAALYLSTSLCGAHRRWTLEEVRRRLLAGAPCQLVSTQVIEAGVDLDFPLVLRALGPLDGIIQAAGRCNREGRLERGRVIVFRPADGGTPPGAYRIATGQTGALLGAGNLNPDDPAVSRSYFQRLFETIDTDREGIQKLRGQFNYPEIARRFRMIDDDTESVTITCYGSPDEQASVRALLNRLHHRTPDGRLVLRRLQPYLVSVRTRQAERYRQQGLIVPVLPGLGEWFGAYDRVLGLTGEGPDPDVLVV